MVLAPDPQRPASLRDRLIALRDHLGERLIERELPLRLALLAALAGEHLLLVGPPGTAKSELARRLRLAFRDATYFERLLTRFSVPEELFGPLSIKALEDDRYERRTTGYLPSASIAFIDEIFKANSAILNALLTLLNEREFDNGDRRVRTPLVAVVGASNELPDDEALGALYDRFLLRCHVGPVSEEGFASLLDLRGNPVPRPPAELRLTLEDLDEIRREAQDVTVPDDIRALLAALRLHLAEQRVAVSDRRWRKIVALLQMSAYTNGRTRVSIWDCWLLQHCTWTAPEQRQGIFDWYQARAGTLGGVEPERLTRLVTAWEAKLAQDQRAQSQQYDERGRLLYVSPAGRPTIEANGQYPAENDRGEALFLAPANRSSRGDRTNAGRGWTRGELENQGLYREDVSRHAQDPANRLTVVRDNKLLFGPRQFTVAEIEGRRGEISRVMSEVDGHLALLDEQMASLKERVDEHLWIAPGFSPSALANLAANRERAAALRVRLEAVREGYAKLPVLTEELP
jgi:MoxR-like ATPase